MKVIQERLGHASAMVTLNTYAHLMPNSQKAALGRFETLLAGKDDGEMFGRRSQTF